MYFKGRNFCGEKILRLDLNAKFCVFRVDLISRLQLNHSFRGDLFSRMGYKQIFLTVYDNKIWSTSPKKYFNCLIYAHKDKKPFSAGI